MKPKSDLNQKPKPAEPYPANEVVNKLFGNLDSLALETTLAAQNSSLSDLPPAQTSFVPQPAIYITEHEGQFCLLDYSEGQYEPQAVPLKKSALANSTVAKPLPQEPVSPKSNPLIAALFGKRALFWGMALGVIMTYGLTRVMTPASRNDDLAIVEQNASSQAVTIAEVATAEIDSNLDFSGTVTAYEQIPVMSQAQGLQIADVLVEKGDVVQQGQVLARLNDQVLQAELLQAQAAVQQSQARLDEQIAGSRAEEVAQAEFRVASAQTAIAQAESDLELVQKRVERNTTLQAEGAISRDSLDEILNQERAAKSALARSRADLAEEQEALRQVKAGNIAQTIAQARAELAQSQGRLQGIEAQLADTIIKAPRAGLVASREARVGQITATSEMLFSIIQDSRLELRLRIPETLIGKIKLGQTVRISANNNPELNLLGKVRAIEPLIDDSTRQATVKVELPDSSNLRPGMFVQAAINTGQSKGLAIPIKALLPLGTNQGKVFVLQPDETVQTRKVKVGEILAEQRVEIIEGLKPGDKVIVQGASYLKDGDQVSVKGK